jgi:hypothetical protein
MFIVLKAKFLSLLVMMTMLLGLLAACGPENATNTPVPPSPTVPPTNTALPPAPTNTTGTAGAGAQTTPGTGATTGKAVSAADQQLILDAITTTRELKSYHMTLDAGGEVFTQPVKVEGDYVAPDRAYFKGTLGGEPVEQLVAGGKTYRKDASGQWTEFNEEAPDTGMVPGAPTASDLTDTANVLEGLGSLMEAATGFTELGTETMHGVSTRHFAYKLDMSQMGDLSSSPEVAQMMQGLPPLGGGEIWIDPATKYVHKMTMDVDMGPLMQLFTQMLAGAFAGTPEPGTPTATPMAIPSLKFTIGMSFSKHNDPSITVPEPPAGSTSAPTATTGAMAEPTTDTGTSTDLGTATTGSTGTSGSGQTYKVGDSATLGGLKITVNSAKDVPATDFFKPEAGMRFVAVDVNFENTTGEPILVSSILMTKLKDGKGTEYDLDIGATVATGGKQPDGEVPANGTLSGPFGYQIPTDATDLQWVFSEFPSDNTVTFDIAP